jgi:hypothetical protein
VGVGQNLARRDRAANVAFNALDHPLAPAVFIEPLHVEPELIRLTRALLPASNRPSSGI